MKQKFPFKNVLIHTQYFKPEMGAPQVRLWELCKELKAQGISVEVLTCMPNYPIGKIHKKYLYKFFKTEFIDDIKIRRVAHYPVVGKKPLRRLISYFSFLFTSFFPLIFSKKPDLIFVEAQPIILAIPALVLKYIRGVPYIYNTPDLQVEYADEKKWIKFKFLIKLAAIIESHLMKNALSTTTVTHSFIRFFIKNRSIKRNKFSFFPNGADTSFLKPKRPDMSLMNKFKLQNKIIFSYVGTHSSYQGLETIVKAAKYLTDYDDIVILMVGNGSERDKLIAMAKSLELKNIYFKQSPFTEMDSLMSITYASIVTLRDVPSARRMRLSKAIPPISCGVPVLYAGYGETLDILLEYDAGLAIKPEDPEDLANKILNFSKVPEKRLQMSKNCRHLALKQFTWKNIINNWQDQIQDIKDGREPFIENF